jgi:hypothetical protein
MTQNGTGIRCLQEGLLLPHRPPDRRQENLVPGHIIDVKAVSGLLVVQEVPPFVDQSLASAVHVAFDVMLVAARVW